MNKSIIVYTLGTVLKIEALILMAPTLCAVYYSENVVYAYLITAIVCAVIGFSISFKKPKNTTFYLREGCLITVLAWIVLSVFGAIPFAITGEMNGNFLDSLYESISGFTTTGSTILSDVEVLSKATQLWRSLTHWIGGMGVLVFLLALIPLSGGSPINLMRAESSGPSVGKLAPRLRSTAQILYTIYIALTLLQIMLLTLGNTPFFDSVNIALSTTGTGGFGIKNDSLASYSPYVQWVTTIFMVLSATKYNFFFYLIIRKVKKAFSFDEVRVFFAIFAASWMAIMADVMIHHGTNPDTVRHAAFTAASIMSTTGFSTVDYVSAWPAFSQSLIMVLTFIGGCIGSTAGGFKVGRVVILFKSFLREIQAFLHPRSVKKLRMDGAILDEEIIKSTNAFLVVFVIIFFISTILVSLGESDLVTSFTSVGTSLGNVGPGLGPLVGPSGNYGFHTPLSKIVLMFDMLAGRLELFPIVVLFARRTFKA